MKAKIILLIVFVGLSCKVFVAHSQSGLLQNINPFIGVDQGGNVFPGACLPFSKVSVSPDVTPPQSTAGYLSNRPIIGFSNTHTSGTGGDGRYGNFLVFPLVGDVRLDSLTSVIKDEVAKPAYYSANLLNGNIDAEMTLTGDVAFQQYTFNEGNKATILFDISSVRLFGKSGRCSFSSGKITDSRHFEGEGYFSGGWGGVNPYKIYFAAEFSEPFESSGCADKTNVYAGIKDKAVGSDKDIAKVSVVLKSFFTFRLNKDKKIKLKIAIAYSGLDKARQYLASAKGWDFNQFVKDGQDKWLDYIGRIQVAGGTNDQKALFYTGLYHSAVTPRDLTGDNPLWKSDKPHYWDYYCIWDTWHGVNPLYMLIAPERQSAMIQNWLDLYLHKGWLGDTFTAGDYGLVQGGSDVDNVISEAIQKNLPGFDYQLAYQAIKKNASVNSDDYKNYGRALNPYLKYGYIPATSGDNEINKVPVPTSKTLEYAYNDFCIGLAAKKLGLYDDYNTYLQRSQNAFNLFDPKSKCFWAKDSLGNWLEGFKRDFIYSPWRGPYYEGSAHHYSMSAMQDVYHLIGLHGGEEPFIGFLDEMFEQKFYNPNNEPDIHIPWMYHYAGRPDKTTFWLRELMQKYYKNSRDGLPGNDDAGAISVWYSFASIGFYPVPGQDIYLLSGPLFDKTTIKILNNRSLVIKALNLSVENIYIQSATFNGNPLERSWLRHAEIENGGNLVFQMGNKPSNWGTTHLPPSFKDL